MLLATMAPMRPAPVTPTINIVAPAIAAAFIAVAARLAAFIAVAARLLGAAQSLEAALPCEVAARGLPEAAHVVGRLSNA
jgi:hypothetical protein